MSDDGPGFFRNLAGYATAYVAQKRKALQTQPETNVDSAGTSTSYTFDGQEIDFDDLREIKAMREDGGQVAQLMTSKALLNFGEGAEFGVEDNEDTEQMVDGEPMTLQDWLESAFPHIDLLVLDLGEDALWYPYAVGETIETRGGGFDEALPAEPWTLLPETDSRGRVVGWHQRTKSPQGGYKEQRLSADDLWHIVLNKSSARDQTGISEVLRSKDEIQAFKENEQAINNAIELHGFPQRHVKVGDEDGAPVRDDDLRRVRTIFDPRTSDANTAYFTGQDVDVQTLEAQNFDFSAIHEMDMRNLTTALGLPLEAGNVGADGLGSGKPAELRFALLKLAIKANQRSFSTQFIEQVVRPVVKRYSPFDETERITLRIDDPLEDIGETADLIQQVGDYMTNDEVRRRLDLPEPEDDEIGESYRSPGEIEKAEEGDGEPGGLDQIFGERAADAVDAELEGRDLADIPEKYTDGTGLSESDFVPNSDVESVVDDVLAFIDAEGLPNPENQREGAARANQLKDHAANDDPLAVEFWQEISNFHARHRAQGNHECDESDLPEAASESEFDECYFDPGYFSDKTWGGDPGKEQADRIVEAIESTEGVELGGETDFSHRCLGGVTDRDLDHAPEWDRPLLEMYQGVSDPQAATDRTLVSFASSGTPEFVLDRIREAIRGGAIFSDIDAVPSDELMAFREEFADAVGTDDFTLDSITDTVMDFTGADRDTAERIARTESTAALNAAREAGYEEKGDADERFYWTGADPGDPRQTDVCGYLIAGQGGHLENPSAFSGLPRPDGTNPFEGGEPLPMDDLKELVAAAARADPEIDTDPRTWTPHINCRSTFVLEPSEGV
jgi:hypothetical protein